MTSRKSKAEAGKENGTEPAKDIAMKDAKANGKRIPKDKPAKEPKKARKDAAVNGDSQAEQGDKVGSGRRAAQNLAFVEKAVRVSNADKLFIKEEAKCETEKEALLHTEAGMPSIKARRLGDCSVADEDGHLAPIESVVFSQKPLFISGVIYPSQGAVTKETGRRVERFGPLRSFCVDTSGKEASVVVTTDAGSYTVLKPSVAYKKVFSNLAGQSDIFYEVFQALSPQHGGSAFATLEEVVARLARAKATKGFANPREGLLLNGRFVLAQLARVDESTGSKAVKFGETDFAKALSQALADFTYVGAQGQVAANGGIVIRDPAEMKVQAVFEGKGKGRAEPEADAQMEADAELARQLQAKIDAEMRSKRPGGGKSAQAYIKVSEAEIADDYPPPTPYNKEEDEMDELLLYDEDLAGVDPEYLPRRLLTDFSIYNSEGLFASLELLPMWSGVDPDVELYASGLVVDDDGDFSGAQTLQDASAAGGSGAGGSGSGDAGGSGSGSTSAPAPAPDASGMRLYLSQIREWVVEYGADMLFISIRTDVAWYRVSVPSPRYKPWFDAVLKCARVAARVLGMLSEESRASKLSFGDVVKRLSKEEDTAPTFISKKPEHVERFLSVHGQILLNCFKNYPVPSVRNAAFVTQLKDRLALVRHSKLYLASAKPSRLRGVNRNPMKDRAAGARSKPMTATATTMVKSIWQAYFAVGQKAGQEEAAITAAGEGEVAQEVEDDVNEEENEEEEAENALAEGGKTRHSAKSGMKAAAKPKAAAANKVDGGSGLVWLGAATAVEGGLKMYSGMKVGGVEIFLGDAVELLPEESDDSDADMEEPEEDADESAAAPLGLVQALWQDASGGKHIQVRMLARGVDTVLGDAASDSEVFLTTDYVTRPLGAVVGKANVRRLQRVWDASRRGEQFLEDQALRQRNEDAAAEGSPLELFWRREYVPMEGMFRDPPSNLRLGERLPEGEQGPATGVRALEDGKGFVKDGVTYREGDFMFVGPEVFDQMPEAQRDVQLPEYLANSRFHKGSHVGLRAWGIGRLVKLGAAASKKTREGKEKVSTITLQRFWRPEDISEEVAYKAETYYDVYASEEHVTVDVEDVVGPVRVIPAGSGPTDISAFACVGSFNRKTKAFGDIPADVAALASPSEPDAANGKGKGKGKAVADVEMADALAESKGKGKSAEGASAFPGDDGIALATMDIFAGCGGLSEGMHQAGAAFTKWAIEYEHPAAESFKLNNPQAATFCNNCNVLLHAAMAKAGLETDCLASEEAVQQSRALPADEVAALPLPGEVDFICGGPPCQGYSGMNRFNKGNWSMVQNSMVMAFLSYADFYRPRYFLLENVRNFVSHNKSFTFRLTVRSLLDMGYQVRFGVLNAGNFGVAQSRKRTFIFAAAPGELLPEWPKLMHCFRTPQLTINLPGNVQYTAVPQTDGAPLRPVTVREAIGDLPPIANGHDCEEMDFSGPPQSAFQRAIRGDCTRLMDHISKQMNELNLERCRCIPKNCPGADWRVLEEIVRQDPSREKFKGQPLVPWCLPNTADRHNGWRGLFGRLDWHGHFPTSTTDPQPMGKVGQVFHPEQDRIVSVRECARAQGFPDKHRFYGNVHNKHRQVGNAVPPPLAAALGRQLRKALEAHAEAEARAALEAQMA